MLLPLLCAMAAAMLLELHGALLRQTAVATGVHFQGLNAVAAHLRRQGGCSRTLLRRLGHLDSAAGVVRHITSASSEQLTLELAAAFGAPTLREGPQRGVPE